LSANTFQCRAKPAPFDFSRCFTPLPAYDKNPLHPSLSAIMSADVLTKKEALATAEASLFLPLAFSLQP
jgi:hypothetical protein